MQTACLSIVSRLGSQVEYLRPDRLAQQFNIPEQSESEDDMFSYDGEYAGAADDVLFSNEAEDAAVTSGQHGYSVISSPITLATMSEQDLEQVTKMVLLADRTQALDYLRDLLVNRLQVFFGQDTVGAVEELLVTCAMESLVQMLGPIQDMKLHIKSMLATSCVTPFAHDSGPPSAEDLVDQREDGLAVPRPDVDLKSTEPLPTDKATDLCAAMTAADDAVDSGTYDWCRILMDCVNSRLDQLISRIVTPITLGMVFHRVALLSRRFWQDFSPCPPL